MAEGLTVNPGYLTLACTDLDARPLFWTEHNGSRHGYEPAVADAVAKQLRLSVRWLFLQWSEFGDAVLNGEADAIWCGSAITPEREKTFLYSSPYAVFNESLLVNRDSGIRSADDLTGLRVGAINGSTNMALAESWPGCQCIGFDGASDDVFGDMIQSLRDGTIDAVVDDEPAFGGLLDVGEFEIAFTVDTRNRWGAAKSPSSGGLKQSIDTALDTLKQSGELQAIWCRWLKPIHYPDIV